MAPVPTKGGRHYTVSIAVAGSILLNAQSPELRTYLVGEVRWRVCVCAPLRGLDLETMYISPSASSFWIAQIARAAAIFQVDEIVVYGDESAHGKPGWSDPNLFFARVLQYMEMPQYLRKVGVLLHGP